VWQTGEICPARRVQAGGQADHGGPGDHGPRAGGEGRAREAPRAGAERGV